MTHSTTETRGSFFFHSQMLCDFATMEELAGKMLKELRTAGSGAWAERKSPRGACWGLVARRRAADYFGIAGSAMAVVLALLSSRGCLFAAAAWPDPMDANR